MMHEVEERLRSALRDHAEDAPAGAAMLTAVVVESGRRRRRAVVASAAAAVTAVLAGVALSVPLLSPAPALTVAAPPTTAPPTVTPPAVAPSVAGLVPAAVPGKVTFPLTAPSVAGYGVPSVWRAVARPYLRQTVQEAEPGGVMAFSAAAYPVRPEALGPSTATTVRGRPATVVEWSDETGVQRSLVWQEDPATWIELRTEPVAADPDRLRAYAESLRAQPANGPVPFTFALMPAGWTVDNIMPTSVTFCPPDVLPGQGFTDKLAVMLNTTADPSGTAVKVGTRGGWLHHQEDSTTLEVPLGDGRSLVFQLMGRATLSDEDLVRLAAGTAVTPDAEVGNG
ncbi:hypothetical protein KZZ52_04950 [Dactylosporangium sp. AC04546]|uniref:hypothetical protein n=1 Tax=Dactylosporangium sp. AC04546 TaxID=2862460 RepID=UPI001EDDA998|nr:hypothetical protein [Dactylosporangium sp. AC04546]WVK84763.1 hypothetical protein KZZ52_04950 [Dactylosporangium sp. AC04546]